MFTTQNYVVASSLDEAYELNQKPKSTVLGGCGWLKMGRRMMSTAIDLSGLGLDQITEHFGDCIAESVRHIVGVQFRGCATIGGSIWGRFGFSDPLTLFLALGAEVVLHKGGTVALSDFVHMPYDRDILVEVRLPKRGQQAAYVTHRVTATDFPVLAVAACGRTAKWSARSARAHSAPSWSGARRTKRQKPLQTAAPTP